MYFPLCVILPWCFHDQKTWRHLDSSLGGNPPNYPKNASNHPGSESRKTTPKWWCSCRNNARSTEHRWPLLYDDDADDDDPAAANDDDDDDDGGGGGGGGGAEGQAFFSIHPFPFSQLRVFVAQDKQDAWSTFQLRLQSTSSYIPLFIFQLRSAFLGGGWQKLFPASPKVQ